MATGLYPYSIKKVSGEISRENKVFASRLLKFHKLSGYISLYKGTTLFLIILICECVLRATEKTPPILKKGTPTGKNKLSLSKEKNGSKTMTKH